MPNQEKCKEQEPLVCVDPRLADIRFHDGALPHVVGAKSYQVLRACRDGAVAGDGYGWTYNHAPMLAWWKGSFFLEYLSNQVSEHIPPCQALLCTSEDGAHWSEPKVVFPPYHVPSAPYRGPKKELLPPDAPAIVHHRMGFYVTKSGRLLVLSFYSLCPDYTVGPNIGWGIGRVVREIYPDHTLSPIYFIRYNRAGGFNETNTPHIPFYKTSPDVGFVSGCDELLNDRLVTQQWWEEERLDKDFFTRPDGRALSYYTRKDGAVVGVFKEGKVSITRDRGETWSPLKIAPSIRTESGKVWGQRTSDGRYALAYNPSTDGAHRWPIGVVTSEDGRIFDNLMAATTEVPPLRFSGILKSLGPQYIRGICEDNPSSPDGDMWICYSMSKEDIWVTRLPVPITGTWQGPVHAQPRTAQDLREWDLYVPRWCPVEVEEARGLVIADRDRYDRAKVGHVIEPAEVLEMRVRLQASPACENSKLTIELQDDRGAAPVQVIFDWEGWVVIKAAGAYERLGTYEKDTWYELEIVADCAKSRMTIRFWPEEKGNMEMKMKCRSDALFSQNASHLDRILFTTKRPFDTPDLESSGRELEVGDLPHADDPLPESIYCVKSLQCKTVKPWMG